ncbi:MAG: hypothetical protein AAFO82_05150, partial [Bacteroidota bacterium]
MKNIRFFDQFVDRHIGPNQEEQQAMLSTIGVSSLDQLIDETVPEGIRMQKKLDLPEALSEHEYLRELKATAAKNKPFRS